MYKDWEHKECMGECPKCGSLNLEYDCSEAIDDGRVYPFVCNDCGCEGRECYNEVYVETDYNLTIKT